ncbi:hypothetical protein DL98DRAFT_584834 [Cadophora sp. DSE1049]|nr:hypothetical protein DL98DRAFT_584834 [Cadophora sp. DSE1049]
MKLIYFSKLLVLVTVAIFSAETARALPSPGSHPTLGTEGALDFSDAQPNTDILSSSIHDKRSMTDVNCLKATGQNWSPAPVNQAQSATDFLKATTAICAVRATSCVRVSCVDQAAVYLCNNNNYEFRPTCFKISGYAQALVDQCPTASQGGGRVVGGQAWDNENWNVFIREEDCNQWF